MDHSPTPWTYKEESEIRDAEGDPVMFGHPFDGAPSEADAAFIVRTVNTHEDLVRALRDAQMALKKFGARVPVVDILVERFGPEAWRATPTE